MKRDYEFEKEQGWGNGKALRKKWKYLNNYIISQKERNQLHEYISYMHIYANVCPQQPEDNLWKSDLFTVWILGLYQKEFTGLVEIAFIGLLSLEYFSYIM